MTDPHDDLPTADDLLNLYAQPAWHDDAYIVGTIGGLERLRRALTTALDSNTGETSVVCGDGEGFTVKVLCTDADSVSRIATPYTADVAVERSARTPAWKLFYPNPESSRPAPSAPKHEFRLDADGYPTAKTLTTITHWPVTGSLHALFDALAHLVRQHGYAWQIAATETRLCSWHLATGGWSGNEDMLLALQSNYLVWSRCWVSSERGGKYVFELPQTPA